jgi:hypothetical protein|tara:strand:+ start:340 stop:633 length:294 start_codon:yes stop_codon:yes gene_type:complete
MQMPIIDMVNIFRDYYRSREIHLVPEVIRFGKNGHHVYELSEMRVGTPEFSFKVHVLTLYGKETGLSEIFKTEEQAERYISQDFFVNRPPSRVSILV